MKKFLALLMALTLCLSLAAPAFAAGAPEDDSAPEILTANDGVVVYEDDSFVVIDTRSATGTQTANTVTSARATTYQNHWFNAGSVQYYDMRIHTDISGTFGITFGIDDSSRTADALVMFTDLRGNPYTLGNTGMPSCLLGKVNGSWVSQKYYVMNGMPSGDYIVSVGPVNAPNGCRIMCWIYDV